MKVLSGPPLMTHPWARTLGRTGLWTAVAQLRRQFTGTKPLLGLQGQCALASSLRHEHPLARDTITGDGGGFPQPCSNDPQPSGSWWRWG